MHVQSRFFLFNYFNNYSNLVPPKMKPFTFGDDPLEAGQSASVQCAISEGDLPINISWSFNNKPLISTEDISIAMIGRKSSGINIDIISHKHAGNYTCTGMNSAGISSYTAVLNINGLLL